MAHDIDQHFLAEAAEAPCFKPLKRRERIPITLAPDPSFTGLAISEPLPQPEIMTPARRHNPKYLLTALGIGLGFGLVLGAGLPTDHHGGVVYLPPAIPAPPPPMIIKMDSSVSPPVTQDGKVLLFKYFEQWRQHHRQ
jgi:hypothetical protein